MYDYPMARNIHKDGGSTFDKALLIAMMRTYHYLHKLMRYPIELTSSGYLVWQETYSADV